ncbi:MAG: MlaD family protein, partial [Acidiferrobacterales bacterium]
MSKKANPTFIGAFIVGAIAIVTVMILLLSGNVLFKEEVKAIMYFDGSVTGLNVGAPVKFRGVKIGTVTDIKLIIDKKSTAIHVPVIVKIDRDSYLVRLEDNTVKKASEVFIDTKKFSEQGLHAQLKLNSLLTGQLYIELEFAPGTKFKLRGDGTMREIPTSATAMQEIRKTLEEYPLQELLDNIASTMVSIDKILSDPVILETVHSLNRTLKLAEKTFTSADGILREDSQLM